MNVNIGDNIRNIRKRLDLSQLALAQKVGISDSYLSKIEKGNIETPGRELIANIAGALNVSVGELFGEVARVTTRLIPLLSLVQAGEWTGIRYPGIAEDYIETDLVAANLFALRVHGDSMEPLFHEGETIIINPDFEVLPGNYCVAKIDDDNATTLKQLKKIDTVYFLHPLNPAYEDIPVTKKVRIVGKVVRSQKDW